MWKKFLIIVSALALAFGILFTSVFRTAAVKYDFEKDFDSGPSVLGEETVNIDYVLPYPGRIHPDHFLWPVKAARDRIWLWITTNPTRRAELRLLFADKRLGSAKLLFEKGNPEIGLSTLTKAEKYLEEAGRDEQQNREMGIETAEFLKRLANASLKHYSVMQEIYGMAPDEAKPIIVQSEDYPKRVFEGARNALLEKGLTPAKNPFEW